MSLLLAACRAGAAPDAAIPPPDAGVRADAARPDAQADVEGTGEWTFLIRWVRFPELPPSGSREVAGLDLDGHVTASTRDPIGCFVEDWVAPARYVETAGIDNRAPDVISAIGAMNPEARLNHDVIQSIRDGGALHAVRITRIGDPIDDGEVDVAIFRVEATAPLILEAVVIEGETLELPAAGQTFRVHPDALLEGRPRTELVDASLRGGRLFTPGAGFSLRIPTNDGPVLSLELRGTRVAGRVSEDALSDGLLAGWVHREDVPATIASLELDPPVDPATIEALAELLSDHDDDGDGTCEGISIALQIEGVAAQIVFP